MFNVIFVIIKIFFIVFLNIFTHELFHYLSLKINNDEGVLCFGTGKKWFKWKDLEVRAYPFMSSVYCKGKPKNESLFYISGMLGNLFLALLFLILGIKSFCVYSLIVFFLNLISIHPLGDMYKFLKIDKKFKQKTKMKMTYFHIILSTIVFIFSIVVLFIL